MALESLDQYSALSKGARMCIGQKYVLFSVPSNDLMPQNEGVLTILTQFGVCEITIVMAYVPDFQDGPVARLSTAKQKGLGHHGVFQTWSAAEVHGYCEQTSEG
ncbi:hypothetical protein N7467_001656 [Penicillium canescens]|nr:hypothetical protein N7467_001656 [Penicillium canescens]